MNDVVLSSILINTLTSGSIFALVAIGFVVMYRATRVVSFAQGAFMVIGALVFTSLANDGWGLYPSLILSVVILLVGGVLTYRIVFARIVGAEPFVTAVATIALSIVLQACAIMIWGAGPLQVPPLLSGNAYHLAGSLQIAPAGVLTIVLAAVVIGGLIVGLQRTHLGLRMRAVADGPRLAAYAGVNVVRISMLAWALAAGTAAIAGIVYCLTAQPDPSSLSDLGLLAFPAILIGGFDSIWGALIGGFALALIQSIVVSYMGGQWQDVMSYLVLLTILIVRPQGLFGSRELSRV